MFDTTIVLATAETRLSVDSSHFTLRSKGRKIGRIPPTMIGQFIVHPGVTVSAKALDRLGALGIPATFLDWEGRVRSRLVAPWKHDARPRIEQSRVFLDPALREAAARKWVDAKIANAAAVLRQHAGNHPHPELKRAAVELKTIRRRAARASDIAELMGFEGLAGRIYFSVFSHMLRPEWAVFRGRNRRPPADPINAVLSYVYAVLRNEILALLEGGGLDAYIGCLHRNDSRQPSLALDLMEPFRPVLADRLCLRLVNLKTVGPEHFESRSPQPGISITKEGRRAILEAVIPWTNQCDEELNSASPRGLLTREVDRYAAAARTGALDRFTPFYLLAKDAPPCPDPAP